MTRRSANHPPALGLTAIVIPALNEAPRLPALLGSLPERLAGVARLQVIVVDDGSSDRTAEAARTAGAMVVSHRVNLGAGAALETGTEAAIKAGADVIVHMDADGQHSPRDLPALLWAIQAGADYAAGARSFKRPMPLLFIAGNHLLSVVTRLLFKVRHPDTQCGFRAFRASAWPALKWHASDYSFCSEILVRAQRSGVRLRSVPVRTIYLDRYKGTGINDGLGILQKLIFWRLGIGWAA
jgi:glycosyltransferase involved in cell wall biosynthesis